jgi:hypothetical protein
MATIKRLVPKVKVEDRTLFSGHTGDVHLLEFESEDGDTKLKIIVCDDAVTSSNFNTGTEIGDILIDKATPHGYMKTGATTWTALGSVT